MPHTAKKTTHDQAQEKLTLASEAQGSAQKSQEKAGLFRFGMMPNAVDLCSRLFESAMEIQGSALKAFDSCGVGMRACTAISSDLADSGSRSLSRMTELSKEAASCRTINSVIELQQKAAQQAVETCMDTTQKLCTQLHECCVESLQPLQEHGALMSDKIGEAMKKTTA